MAERRSYSKPVGGIRYPLKTAAERVAAPRPRPPARPRPSSGTGGGGIELPSTSDIQAGLVQLLIAGGLFYAFWSGALSLITDAVVAAIRGQDPGDLTDVLLAPGRPRPPAVVSA